MKYLSFFCQGSIPMDLAALSEEEQIAMAIQMSMQDSEMEDSDASRPTTAATDNTEASPLPMDAEQVGAQVPV